MRSQGVDISGMLPKVKQFLLPSGGPAIVLIIHMLIPCEYSSTDVRPYRTFISPCGCLFTICVVLFFFLNTFFTAVTIYPQGNMNVCTKYHCNQSGSYLNIELNLHYLQYFKRYVKRLKSSTRGTIFCLTREPLKARLMLHYMHVTFWL